MTFTDDGAAFYWDRDGAYATFYQDCDEDLVDWAAERLHPQPLAPVVEPISVPRFWAAGLAPPLRHVLQDRAWPLRVGRLQARRMGVRPLTIDSSHSPFFSRPAELAQLLFRAWAPRRSARSPPGIERTAARSHGPFEMMIVILWTVKDRGANVDDQTGALVIEAFPFTTAAGR